MVDQLNAFAAEVTRVAREVGTEGKLGGQAQVPGVAGTWKDLTDNVNVMAANLTEQVRGIVKVVTAVADGDLKQSLTVKAKGEVAALAETINNMTLTLATFADQVTTVAREVGVEGRLGGQAYVPGAAGTWKDLTGNVNLLAANLTDQVRAIADVATAVTKGDLTRAIQVDARGEVSELKDNINTMITNLRLTTERNMEQDWLKTNLARFTGMLQGQRDLVTVGKLLLSELVPLVGAHQGVIYQMDPGGDQQLKLLASYANNADTGYPERLKIGDGFIGQCVLEKRRILVTDVPRDAVPVGSALLEVLPRNVVVFPVMFESENKAVLALASLNDFAASHVTFLEQLTTGIGIVLNSIEATMQTEGLLKQSQQLASELQSRQKDLQQSNEQLEQKAQQLAERNVEVERKTAELALTSKYKSEFLANMSHELRTPLNSILILGQQLGDNPEGNLSDKQIEFARTIHAAGTDLLNLITDILDLSKIESGTVTVDAEEVYFSSLIGTVERTFRHEAENRGLSFEVQTDLALGRSMVTDPKRLQQVLKNLLSNAFKFTSEGGVKLDVSVAASGWTAEHQVLAGVPAVVAFQVSDTGVGIPAEKQKIIFEAFQQADAGTSRKYGGTGLGLAISRELANLLGGEIQLRSVPDLGSTFTLYLPLRYVGPAAPSKPSDLPAIDPAAMRANVAEQPRPPDRVVEPISDDRDGLTDDDTTLLVVEDDPHYARILLDLAHDNGFKVVVAHNGADALELARRINPSAVSLDVFLPDMLGWTVLSELKQDPLTRHIPVQMVTLDEDRQHGLARGAFAFVTKPTSATGLDEALTRMKEFIAPRPKRLLVVEDNPAEQLSIGELLGDEDIRISAVGTRRGVSRGAARGALRLRRARPAAPGHLGLRRARGDPRRRRAARHSGRRVHGQGALARGRHALEEPRAQRGGEGRRIARAPARRDVAVPAPRGGRPQAREAAHARAAARLRRVPDRQVRARGRRRRAQHLRALERARAPRHERAHGDHRTRGDRAARSHAQRRARAHGHHDAGDGRLQDDAGDPPAPGAAPPADHRPDGEGDEGRPREVPRGGSLGLSREAGEHGTVAVCAEDVAAPLGIGARRNRGSA